MDIKIGILVMFISLTLAAQTPLEEFTSGNNLFTASMYKEIQKTQNGNLLLSPFSAESVLALAHSGAKDSTAEEIRTVLHLPQTQEEIKAAFKTLQPNLRRTQPYSLQSANKIYIKEGFDVKNDFKKNAIDVFGADLEEINFDQREAAAKAMNAWVEGKTDNKIKNLVSTNDLDDRTKSILVNALYFKGNWSATFAKYATRKEEFHKSGGSPVLVDMMYDNSISTGLRSYYESKDLDAKFLEMEFEGGDVTMTIVLPNDKDGIAKLENNLEKVLPRPEYTRELVKIYLPKFTIESSINVGDIVKQLGVRKVFKDEEADLSGIAGKKGDLVINKVLQKSRIDVNEEGVEAAAATYAVVGVPLSGFISSSPIKEFKADHPFLFYIKVKDLVIFAGRVVDPSQ